MQGCTQTFENERWEGGNQDSIWWLSTFGLGVQGGAGLLLTEGVQDPL